MEWDASSVVSTIKEEPKWERNFRFSSPHPTEERHRSPLRLLLHLQGANGLASAFLFPLAHTSPYIFSLSGPGSRSRGAGPLLQAQVREHDARGQDRALSPVVGGGGGRVV